jgi:hypothetical protein
VTAFAGVLDDGSHPFGGLSKGQPRTLVCYPHPSAGRTFIKLCFDMFLFTIFSIISSALSLLSSVVTEHGKS